MRRKENLRISEAGNEWMLFLWFLVFDILAFLLCF